MKFTAYALSLSCGLLAFTACSSPPSQVDGMPPDECSGCAANQLCTDGTCVDLPKTCPCPAGSSCDPVSNSCMRGCRTIWDCPRSTDPCRVSACHAGICGMDDKLDGTECAPLELCSFSVCEAGRCVSHAHNDEGSCLDDGDPCTNDVCIAGRCAHPAVPDYSGSCPDDGNPCTDDVCIAARCAHPAGKDFTFCGSGTGDGRFKQCLGGVCTWDRVFCIRDFPLGCTCGIDDTGMGNYSQFSRFGCYCGGKDLVFPVPFGMTQVLHCANACSSYSTDIMTCL